MTAPATNKGVCRCEARIAPAVLEGYACGNVDCWRTAKVLASFDAFVQKLVADRADPPIAGRTAPPSD